MSVFIEKETEVNVDFNVEELIKSVIDGCIDYVDCPYECMVNVTFVDNASIREINKEQRDIDRATDVLSFPMLEYDKPGDFEFLESDEDIVYDCFEPDTGELTLGDIVISIERAKEQAVEYGHSLKREVAFLCAHSMFHLFGYDHMEEDERIIMEEKQKDVLDRLGITRDV